MSLVEYRCGACHQVRGTHAGALAAPDLTHLMSRRTIAAGTLPNGPGTLAEWIEAPQALKPGTLMPESEPAAASAHRRAGLSGDAAMRAERRRLPHADHRGGQRRAPGTAAGAVGDGARPEGFSARSITRRSASATSSRPSSSSRSAASRRWSCGCSSPARTARCSRRSNTTSCSRRTA